MLACSPNLTHKKFALIIIISLQISMEELTPQTLAEDPKEEEDHHQEQLIPFSSITLSLTSFSLLSPFKLSPSPTLSPISNFKLPSQISALSSSSCAFSLLTPSPSQSRSRPSSNNLSSLTPLQSLSPFIRRRPSDPSSGVAGRRTAVVWFRSDLRVHDHEALTTASNESLSLLPVFLFDPRDFDKSSSGFDRTGPCRAQFLIQSVSDLRESLRARGSDLVVRVGKPETVLAELAKVVGADALYAHREVSNEEVKAEERVQTAMEEEGIEVKYYWGSTLYHIEDLPFDLEKMPSNYGGFKEKLKGLEVRKTIEALESIKGLPVQGDVEVGEVPTLSELGLKVPPMSQVLSFWKFDS